MGKSKKRLEQIIEKISDELSRAHLYFSVAKILNEKYREDKITSARYFFIGSYFATLREAILSISKLVLYDPESITFKYLLDHIDNHPKIFKHASPEEIKALVASHRKEMRDLKPLFERIRSLRDRELAHFDRKHINDPSSIIPEPINFSELDKCLEILLRILNDYSGAYDNSGLHLGTIEGFTRRDIEYIISLMQDADERRKF